MNKEQQIDALEAQVREQYPTWNNADIRNQAVRMFYMDTTTVLEIISMLDNQINIADKKARESYPSDLSYLYQTASLTAFRDHLQTFIEAELNSAENETRE